MSSLASYHVKFVSVTSTHTDVSKILNIRTRIVGTMNQIDYFNTSILASRCSDFSASASTFKCFAKY